MRKNSVFDLKYMYMITKYMYMITKIQVHMHTQVYVYG